MIQIPSTQVTVQTTRRYTLLEKLQFTVLICVLLYFGRTLLIPLSIALLISCLLYPSCSWMEKKGINKSVAIGIAIFGLCLLFAGVAYLLFLQFARFSNEWLQLRIKLSEAFKQLGLYMASHFGISKEQQDAWLKNIADSSGSELIPFLRLTLYSFSVMFVLLILIPIISALILYYRRQLVKALHNLFPVSEKDKISEILRATVHTYFSFIKGMLLVYLIVGILNSIGLAIIGIPNPILFGFIASILTFIPYVGILIASLLPIAISWITFNSIWYPLGVILVFTIVQYLEANVIFPFAVSNRLNINTLATIVAILVGGILWGGIGMILFIPFLGIIKLIADKTAGLKTLSILLDTNDE